MNKNEELTGTLENWWTVQVSKKEFIINGDCYGDSRGRFPDGMTIHTSGILNRDCEEGDLITTRNSTYKLGKKLVLIDAK